MFGLFGRKHGKRVLKASRRATNAVGMFKKAHDQLDRANIELANVVSEANRQAEEKLARAQREAEELLAHAKQATSDMTANLKVQAKLKDFIEA